VHERYSRSPLHSCILNICFFLLTSTEPLRHSIEVRQTLARSLLDSVASAVKTLTVPLSAVSAAAATGADDKNCVQRVDITAYTLARQYVLLLCRLDLLEVRLFLSDCV